ncbi:DNA-binding TFAR19-related protein [Methanothermus fervidus DSM 2088]|uniref:DNA-binding protein Mfer_0170 n=1 Tax=Methanothermus fervidus (strain ATCC 43054 / DSM 2088 / JCM 10308 / V24 S) TaxID=523846 RepID=E3GXE1_METFV|nr:DNA-binding protein [Methanothermus fervidus]ADP76973.1 DNA-binding TFAR19-related protein [Methanothermus fervidus DSM 2088]
MTDIEEIRRRKLLELQRKAMAEEREQVSEAQKEQIRRQFEIQKRHILRRILTPQARSRLANLRLARPELVEQLELQLIQLASAGQLRSRITDKQLKELLRKISSKRRRIRIKRM